MSRKLSIGWQQASGEFYREGFPCQPSAPDGSGEQVGAGGDDGEYGVGGIYSSRDTTVGADLLSQLPSRRRPSYRLPANIVSGRRVWTGTTAGGRLRNSTTAASGHGECTALCDSDIPDEDQISEFIGEIRYMSLSMREKRIRKRRIMNSAILRVRGLRRVRQSAIAALLRLHSLTRAAASFLLPSSCSDSIRRLSSSCSPAAAVELLAVRRVAVLHILLALFLFISVRCLPAETSTSSDTCCLSPAAGNRSSQGWRTVVQQLLLDSVSFTGVWQCSVLYYPQCCPQPPSFNTTSTGNGQQRMDSMLSVWLFLLLLFAVGCPCFTLLQSMRPCGFISRLLTDRGPGPIRCCRSGHLPCVGPSSSSSSQPRCVPVSPMLFSCYDVQTRCQDSVSALRRALLHHLRNILQEHRRSESGRGSVSSCRVISMLFRLMLGFLILATAAAHCAGVYRLSMYSARRLLAQTPHSANWSTLGLHYAGPLTAVMGSVGATRLLCGAMTSSASLSRTCACVVVSLGWRLMSAVSVVVGRLVAVSHQQDYPCSIQHLAASTCYQLMLAELLAVLVVKTFLSPVRGAMLCVFRRGNSSTSCYRVLLCLSQFSPERLLIDSVYVQMISWSAAVVGPFLPALAALHSLCVFHTARMLCLWAPRELLATSVCLRRCSIPSVQWRAGWCLAQLVGVAIAGGVAIYSVVVVSVWVGVAWYVCTAVVTVAVGVVYLRAEFRSRAVQMELLRRRVQMGTRDSRYLLERVCEMDSMSRRRLGAAAHHRPLVAGERVSESVDLERQRPQVSSGHLTSHTGSLHDGELKILSETVVD